jgi:hypothetical protein
MICYMKLCNITSRSLIIARLSESNTTTAQISVAATNTNFIVFNFTWPRFNTIDEHANHYTIAMWSLIDRKSVFFRYPFSWGAFRYPQAMYYWHPLYAVENKCYRKLEGNHKIQATLNIRHTKQKQIY